MFYDQNFLAANAFARDHWAQLWANRDYIAAHDEQLRRTAIASGMQVNAEGIARDYYKEFDNLVLELRNQENGMEILNDLLGVQTVLPIGKTIKLYNVLGSIDDSVAISMDGQAPYSFDHVEYDSDGDPVPIISAGFGVNWRHLLGLRTVGIDLAMDSQRAKLREYNRKLVGLALDGASNIVVDGKQSQGLRNHRNTQKMDLGAGGFNIDLATATPAQALAFFQGPFAAELTANRINKLDVLWVSMEISDALGKVYVENGVTVGTVREYLMRFSRVGDIRGTFGLTGNEFLGYVRRKDYVSPLVGMPTSITPLPRPMPQTNYNFQIMGAMGMQVTADSEGLSGVFYGANLT